MSFALILIDLIGGCVKARPTYVDAQQARLHPTTGKKDTYRRRVQEHVGEKTAN